MRLINLGLLCLIWSASVQSQCYDSGGVETSDLPCDTGTSPTFCCPSGSKCTADGLCMKGKTFDLGSCSDKSGSGGSCNMICNAGDPLSKCPLSSSSSYCCGFAGFCCLGSDVFELESKPSTLPFTKLATTTSTAASKTSSSTSSAKTTAKSSKSSSTSSASSSSTSSAPNTTETSGTTLSTKLVQNATGAQATITSSTTTSTPTSTAVAAGGMSTGSKIGAGIGSAFGLVSFVLLIWFITFMFRRRNQDKLNATRKAEIQGRIGGNSSRGGSKPGFGSEIREVTPSRTGTFKSFRSLSRREPAGAAAAAPIPNLPRQQDYDDQDAILRRPVSSLTVDAPAQAFQSQPPAPYPSNPPPQNYPPISPQSSYRTYQPLPSHPQAQIQTISRQTSRAQTIQISPQSSVSERNRAMGVPKRKLTAAQELAAARMRSNMSPMGLKVDEG